MPSLDADVIANDLLGRLRGATGHAHRRLERGLGYLLKPTLTRRRYRRLLEGFHGFYAPLERRLDALATGLSWGVAPLGLLSRAPLLERDLDGLARSDGEARLPTAFAEAHLPDIRCGADLLGVLYVVEGAALGGRVIWPVVTSTLALPLDEGCAFFRGRGEDTRARWREVLAVLAARPEAEHAAIVAAARDCFEALDAGLRSLGCLDEGIE